MAASAAAAGGTKRSRSASDARGKDWCLRHAYEKGGDLSTLEDLALVRCPFDITPERTHSIPEEYTVGLQHLGTGLDDAPWPGYYGEYRGARIAVANAFGVWFEIEKKPGEGWTATRTARTVLKTNDWPVDGLNLDKLTWSGWGRPPPPVAPFPKGKARLEQKEPISDVEEDGYMGLARSSQTERGRGGPPRRPKGHGDDPYTLDDLDQDDSHRKPRRLEGNPPKHYDGERGNTIMFLTSFKRFMRMNRHADIARDPFQKCSYFLGLMDGPDTEGWVLKQDEWLDKIERDPSVIPWQMTPWDVMEGEFKKMFVDYARHERATKALGELKMEKGNVDHYIARFQQLAMEGGHDIDQPSLMTMFAKGLPTGLADKCYDHDPDTFDDWAGTAQKCHKVWLKKQAAKGNLSATQPNNPWKNLRFGNQNTGQRGRGGQQGKNPTRYTPRDPNAMDTSADTIRKAVTDADKLKHRQEGRCYECSKQGHVARNCPDRKPRARKTEVEDVNETKAATGKVENLDDGETLADYALKLSDDSREAFIRKIMGTSGEDFSEV
jgi:Retrotransposon gag protein